MNIYTPLFLDGDDEVAGKFLVIAENETDAIEKTEAVLQNSDMLPHLLPCSHWTPFAKKVRINVIVDGILCL